MHAATPAEDGTPRIALHKLKSNARSSEACRVYLGDVFAGPDPWPPPALADVLPRQHFGAVPNQWRPSDIGLGLGRHESHSCQASFEDLQKRKVGAGRKHPSVLAPLTRAMFPAVRCADGLLGDAVLSHVWLCDHPVQPRPPAAPELQGLRP